MSIKINKLKELLSNLVLARMIINLCKRWLWLIKISNPLKVHIQREHCQNNSKRGPRSLRQNPGAGGQPNMRQQVWIADQRRVLLWKVRRGPTLVPMSHYQLWPQLQQVRTLLHRFWKHGNSFERRSSIRLPRRACASVQKLCTTGFQVQNVSS